MKQYFPIFSIALFTLLMSACGTSKELTSVMEDDSEDGPANRLALANKYYDESDYYKAIQLYEVVINENIMVNDLEEVYFHYANSHFAQEDYGTASTLYNSFYKAYPNSENAETAYYFRALCSYNMAEDDYRLDQSTMVQAMREFQDYVIIYPEGEHVEEAKQKIEEIKIEKERKELSVGRLYFKIGEYKAAIAEYNRFIEDYPTSELVEEAYFEMLKSRYQLAMNSIEAKKKERLEAVITHYGYFMDKYSTGDFASEANKIEKQVKEELKSL